MTTARATTAAQRIDFDQRLDVSGIILTKTDGDARGGAALAVREVTGKPIRYVGVGEKIDQLEKFVPHLRRIGPVLRGVLRVHPDEFIPHESGRLAPAIH